MGGGEGRWEGEERSDVKNSRIVVYPTTVKNGLPTKLTHVFISKHLLLPASDPDEHRPAGGKCKVAKSPYTKCSRFRCMRRCMGCMCRCIIIIVSGQPSTGSIGTPARCWTSLRSLRRSCCQFACNSMECFGWRRGVSISQH